MTVSHVERLLNALDKRIEDATDLSGELHWRLLQSGACAMLAAVQMDERRSQPAVTTKVVIRGQCE